MKLLLTAVAMALSVLAIGPVYAEGADGSCAYGSQYRYTSVEPQEQSEATRKLASLSKPATDQETAASARDNSGTPQAAEPTTAQ